MRNDSCKKAGPQHTFWPVFDFLMGKMRTIIMPAAPHQVERLNKYEVDVMRKR